VGKDDTCFSTPRTSASVSTVPPTKDAVINVTGTQNPYGVLFSFRISRFGSGWSTSRGITRRGFSLKEEPMKHSVLTVLGFCVFSLAIAKGQERSRLVDPWIYWNVNVCKLWGANIYQEIDPRDRKKWRPLLRRHDFEDLQRAGANYVNLSVPGPFEPESGSYNADDWGNLKQRIEWAKGFGLKVVISFRTAPGRNEADITNPFTSEVKRDLLDDPKSPNVAKFCEMWKMVAKEYGKDDAVVGFDLLVEPHAPRPWERGKYNDWRFRNSNGCDRHSAGSER
jgi:hypothetical protein